MRYFREDIPSKLISSEKLPKECFSLKKSLRKQKWVIVALITFVEQW